jgi:hypothetical protein
MKVEVNGGEHMSEIVSGRPGFEDEEWEPPVPDDADAETDPDGWMPDELLAAAEEESGPWTGEGEAFAAGFLHHDADGRYGIGFASGGELDVMAPGPELARLLAAATAAQSGGHARLGESELIGAMCAWQRIGAWAAAGQAAAVRTLDLRRGAQARERENQHLAEHVGDEVAAALVLTGAAAGRLVTDAARLAALPEVHAALRAGRIDWRRCVVFGDELAGLGPHDAARIAARVLPGAGRMTTRQIRRALRRAVADLDPEAAARRKADAAADADVITWTEHSGNAALAGRELPAAEVVAADRRIAAMARWLHGHGAAGSLGQLRTAVFTSLLLGRPVTSLLPDTPAGAAAAAATSPGSPLAAAPGGPAITGTVHLTMPVTAWAGISDQSGEIAGHGPADAQTCRDLARQLTGSAATRWCLTLTGPAGQAVAHACARRGPGPAPEGRPALRWAAALAARTSVLAAGTCRHQRQENRYQPSSLLTHLIRTRQRHCSFPGCGRPAIRCDLDHTIAYDNGGTTCECNLAPLCRRHHGAKQAPHWHLIQDQPGHMTWQTPSGHTYQTAGETYPA